MAPLKKRNQLRKELREPGEEFVYSSIKGL